MTDESDHSKSKRQIAHAYSLSTLVDFEPLVDHTTEVFLTELSDRFASTGTICDFGKWLQFFAFDGMSTDLLLQSQSRNELQSHLDSRLDVADFTPFFTEYN